MVREVTYPELKKIYENLSGETVSDRQWQRIRHEYLRGRVNLTTVKTLAHLRKANGRKRISIADVDRLKGFEEFAKILSGEVRGQDILDAFKRLKPTPSESTIRRWGRELNLPLVKDQWYTASQAQKWVLFVGDRVRFKFPENALKKRGA